MSPGLFGTLAAAAVAVGSLHTLAPDHWVPFAALARAQRWSAARTARVTVACGFGHVTVSALLGLLGLFLGHEMMQAFGRRMEAAAGILLVGFGLAYGVWGLRRAAGKRLHGHAHAHYDHVHDPAGGQVNRADMEPLAERNLDLVRVPRALENHPADVGCLHHSRNRVSA